MYFGELAEKSIDYQRGHDIGGKRMADFLIKELDKVVSSGGMERKEDIISFLKKKELEWLQHCREFGMGKNVNTGVNQFG